MNQFQNFYYWIQLAGPGTGIYLQKYFTQSAEFCFSDFVLIAT